MESGGFRIAISTLIGGTRKHSTNSVSAPFRTEYLAQDMPRRARNCYQ